MCADIPQLQEIQDMIVAGYDIHLVFGGDAKGGTSGIHFTEVEICISFTLDTIVHRFYPQRLANLAEPKPGEPFATYSAIEDEPHSDKEKYLTALEEFRMRGVTPQDDEADSSQGVTF